MPVQINFTLSFDGYLAAQRLHNKRSWWPRTWQILNRTLVPALGVLFIVLGLLISGPKMSWFVVLYIIGVGIFLACYPLYLRYRYKTCYRRTRVNNGECTATFDQDNIFIAVENAKSEFGWKAVTHFSENETVIMIYLAPSKFIAVPKSICSPSQIEELQALLANCTTGPSRK